MLIYGLTEGGVARFSVLIVPLAMWLWIAGGIFALGGCWPSGRTAR